MFDPCFIRGCLQQIQRGGDGGHGAVHVGFGVSGGGHAAKTGEIDSVQKHGATKSMNKAGSLVSSQAIHVAIVRHEVLTGGSRTVVPRQQFETRKLPICDPIGLALSKKIV